MSALTCRRRFTSVAIKCGNTPCATSDDGAGGTSSPWRSTVVKSMLNSWIMLGYSELKSITKTYLSHSPRLGSKTRPPLNFSFLSLGALRSLSGQRYFFLWNSCSKMYSLRSARPPFSVRDHALPARLVSCLVRAKSCTLLAIAIWKNASTSQCLTNVKSRSGVGAVQSKNDGTSSGSISSRCVFKCVRHISLSDHVVEAIMPLAVSLDRSATSRPTSARTGCHLPFDSCRIRPSRVH